MNLLFLSPGTSNYFCGTCLRDHMLASQLNATGHKVKAAALYLPLLLDYHDPALAGPMFFGGLNCYLQQKFALFRKTPRFVDQWFDHPALLRRIGRQAGSTQARDLGAMTLSMLRGKEGNQVKEVLRLTSWIRDTAKPDIVVLSNALLTGLAKAIHEDCGARVICTFQGEDSFIQDYSEPWRTRIIDQLKYNAEYVDLFVAVSHFYARRMSERLSLPPNKCTTVLNGIDASALAPAPQPPAAPTLGFLSRMCHAKGVDTFIEAFLLFKAMPGMQHARARVGGSMTRADEALVYDLKSKVRSAGLEAHVEWFPNMDVSSKAEFIKGCSLLSVPLRYDEAFGLYQAEAMVCGVPLVLPNKGSFPEVTAANGAGWLYDDESPQGLACAWRDALNDPTAAAKRQAAMAAGRTTFTAQRMARDFEQAVASHLPSIHLQRNSL